MSMFEKLNKKILKQLDNMMIHSGQGTLYSTIRYHDFIKSHNITQSMSHRGNCYDNALMESFFGTFKSEAIRLQPITRLSNWYMNCKNMRTITIMTGLNQPWDISRHFNIERKTASENLPIFARPTKHQETITRFN